MGFESIQYIPYVFAGMIILYGCKLCFGSKRDKCFTLLEESGETWKPEKAEEIGETEKAEETEKVEETGETEKVEETEESEKAEDAEESEKERATNKGIGESLILIGGFWVVLHTFYILRF